MPWKCRYASDLKETETNAHKAEEEWQQTTNRYRVQAFSAAPALNVMPSGDAVEVQVRFRSERDGNQRPQSGRGMAANHEPLPGTGVLGCTRSECNALRGCRGSAGTLPI